MKYCYIESSLFEFGLALVHETTSEVVVVSGVLSDLFNISFQCHTPLVTVDFAERYIRNIILLGRFLHVDLFTSTD